MSLCLEQDYHGPAVATGRAGPFAAKLPGGKLTAAAITIVAHILLIIGLANGVYHASLSRQPEPISVRIEPQKTKPRDELAPLPLALARPAAATVPAPMILVAPAPTAIVAASPVMPAPPVSAPAAAPQPSSNAVLTWHGLLLARLEQVKRYPASAQFHRQQGVVLLRFTIDRGGNVLTSRIEKSSGYDLLDQEALTLAQRAQPLPPPPPEVAGNAIELVVPVEFFINRRH